MSVLAHRTRLLPFRRPPNDDGALYVVILNGHELPSSCLRCSVLRDVLVVDRLTRIGFLKLFPRVFKGTHITDPRVGIHRARHVRIEADGVVAYADGERAGPLPIDLFVRPGASRVRVAS